MIKRPWLRVRWWGFAAGPLTMIWYDELASRWGLEIGWRGYAILLLGFEGD